VKTDQELTYPPSIQPQRRDIFIVFCCWEKTKGAALGTLYAAAVQVLPDGYSPKCNWGDGRLSKSLQLDIIEGESPAIHVQCRREKKMTMLHTSQNSNEKTMSRIPDPWKTVAPRFSRRETSDKSNLQRNPIELKCIHTMYMYIKIYQ
jgi:hypothetical protein